jgi:hypothetical protein
VKLQAECTGAWTMFGDCSVPCPQPTGSCCHPDGTCAVVVADQCVGLPWTPGGTCTPNLCPQPTGSCCQPNGLCAVTVQTACNGTSWTDGRSCSPNPCAQSVPGACCSANACRIFYKAYCERLRGVFNGAPTCSPDPCPRPVKSGEQPADIQVEKGSWGQIKNHYR